MGCSSTCPETSKTVRLNIKNKISLFIIEVKAKALPKLTIISHCYYKIKVNIVKFVSKYILNERKEDSHQKINGFFRKVPE
ncbi:hypothetical protein FB2170_13573 [Maribacter sp. HTCC2170]|nr:hypothetical protein FB2170_13573 [Maribacter sp. HTCC2170]